MAMCSSESVRSRIGARSVSGASVSLTFACLPWRSRVRAFFEMTSAILSFASPTSPTLTGWSIGTHSCVSSFQSSQVSPGSARSPSGGLLSFR
jgi:hypothetical protein